MYYNLTIAIAAAIGLTVAKVIGIALLSGGLGYLAGEGTKKLIEWAEDKLGKSNNKEDNNLASQLQDTLKDVNIEGGVPDKVIGDKNAEETNITTPINPNPQQPNTEEIEPIIPGNEIKDETQTNVEIPINGVTVDEWKKLAEEYQQKQWAREDSIRQETQEREDTAYQRAVADARKAGINPNLVNINPAESGGGITQATGIDLSTMQSQMDTDLEKLQQLIDNAFKENENEKDRFNEIFGNLLQTILMALIIKK